jgi:hypothetical protein
MIRKQIIEILKDHELKRTDGVHQVMISGIFPELYDKLAETIELKLSLTQQDEPSVSAEEYFDKNCFSYYPSKWNNIPIQGISKKAFLKYINNPPKTEKQ